MKHRVAAVSYANTIPFLNGLKQPVIRDYVDVVVVPPAQCADMLIRGEVDIALCPVGVFTELDSYHILTDYCIGCDGPVRTVSVFSQVPLAELKQVVLSGESRTSNLLVQVLDREFWKLNLVFCSSDDLDESLIDATGFLHIGDTCFEMEPLFRYRTDLGLEWKQATSLPFVFACWTSVRELNDQFVEKLNLAFRLGIASVDQMSDVHGPDAHMVRDYLKSNISFEYSEDKQRSLWKFLELISAPAYHASLKMSVQS